MKLAADDVMRNSIALQYHLAHGRKLFNLFLNISRRSNVLIENEFFIFLPSEESVTMITYRLLNIEFENNMQEYIEIECKNSLASKFELVIKIKQNAFVV